MKSNSHNGWSLIETLVCICIISIMLSYFFTTIQRSNPLLSKLQIRSILTLSQSIAASKECEVQVTSDNWKQINITFEQEHSININLLNNNVFKYKGFIDSNYIGINKNGSTYNNGTFYGKYNKTVAVVNNMLRFR